MIEAQTPTEDGEYAELPDEAEDGPDLLRVRIDADQRPRLRAPSRGSRGRRSPGLPVLRPAARPAGPLLRARRRPAQLTVADEPLDPPLRVDWLDADRRRRRPPRPAGVDLPSRQARRFDALSRARLSPRAEPRPGEPAWLRRASAAPPARGSRAGALGGAGDRRAMPPSRGAPHRAPAGARRRAAGIRHGDGRHDRHAVRRGDGPGDVAVACMGGVGRTGTVAACALVSGGLGCRRRRSPGCGRCAIRRPWRRRSRSPSSVPTNVTLPRGTRSGTVAT